MWMRGDQKKEKGLGRKAIPAIVEVRLNQKKNLWKKS